MGPDWCGNCGASDTSIRRPTNCCCCYRCTHRPLSSSFWGLPYRILNINHKKELLRGLWVTASAATYPWAAMPVLPQGAFRFHRLWRLCASTSDTGGGTYRCIIPSLTPLLNWLWVLLEFVCSEQRRLRRLVDAKQSSGERYADNVLLCG